MEPVTVQRPLLPAERLPKSRYQALVIGSGFGGAVLACRLAQAGVDVGLIERGRRWPPGSFPRDLSRLDDGWLWACNHGLYDADPLADILSVRAAGYGGGSLVYANVAIRPPREVFADWPAPYSREMLEPWFDLASHMLAVRPTPPDSRSGALPPKSRLMRQAAERVGRVEGFFYPNVAVTFNELPVGAKRPPGLKQQACTLCGECDIGCNEGAKNTLDRNYLAIAEAHGLAVGTLSEALYIAADGDDYRIRLREHAERQSEAPDRDRDVWAQHVFVCAGALGSTELLLRSRDQYRTLPLLPSGLGQGYSGNGDYLSFATDLPDYAEPSLGPTITTASLVRTGAVEYGREYWFLIEDGGFSPHLLRLVSALDLRRLPYWAWQLAAERLRRWLARRYGLEVKPNLLPSAVRRMVVLLAMGRDNADGVISLRGRRKKLRVRWDTKRHDPLYRAEREATKEIVHALGGRHFDSPTWRLLRQPVTVHNLGGCRMATSPAQGVVTTEGEVFGHPGLYVIDGAALPGATAGNPALTITAVAERCAQSAVRRIIGDRAWVAPEQAEVKPCAVPEDAVVEGVRRSGPNLGQADTRG